jgi:phenylpropionate dioxygenase-like ring-hydroxylating dioxygenase large terminal subunit
MMKGKAVSPSAPRQPEPEKMDGGSSRMLRGDPMTGDRYWSTEWMDKEWEHMWKRVWHIGGRVADMPGAGDYVVHNFRHESVLLVRQTDGSFRAFFNVCQHRGNRLVWNESGGVPAFTCAYHGWRYRLDGSLDHAQNPENFSGGDPCKHVKLVQVPCDTWGGFVWFSMDQGARPLLQFLHPIPTLLKNRDMESMVRTVWRRVSVDTNWKFACDNFNESYHLPAVHPMMGVYVDEDYRSHDFEIYANGHNRVVEPGRPSARLEANNSYWNGLLKSWDIDPSLYAGKPNEARLALQRAKRTLGPGRGMTYMNKLTDEELTDFFHHTCFPNVTITGSPGEGTVHIFRTEPHITDPGKCTFEYMGLNPRIEGATEILTVSGMRPFEEAEPEVLTYGIDNVGDFIDEDLSVAVQQQRGLRSMGYQDAKLSEQEARVRRFHEVLNDYIEGRR